jgi:hypothetical protein
LSLAGQICFIYRHQPLRGWLISEALSEHVPRHGLDLLEVNETRLAASAKPEARSENYLA